MKLNSDDILIFFFRGLKRRRYFSAETLFLRRPAEFLPRADFMQSNPAFRKPQKRFFVKNNVIFFTEHSFFTAPGTIVNLFLFLSICAYWRKIQP